MDFPKSVPSVGLVDGKFIDEDAVAGTPGSLIPSAWGNAVTQEILKVIQEAGLEPDEDDNTQLNAAIDQKITGASVEFASQPEAEAGEVTTKAMSPLRVFQAIAKVVTQATEGAFGWLKIASQPQVNAGADDAAAVTAKKLAAAAQAQAHTAFTTAGTAAALTLTPTPAIGAYSAPQRFRVKFSQNSTPTSTINVSGKGGKLIKQYDSVGAKIPAVYVVDQLGDIEYDGADFVLRDPLPGNSQATEAVLGGVKIATQTQVNTGTDDTSAITPLKLATLRAASTIASTPVTMSAAGLVSLANPWGTTPSSIKLILTCATADIGYSPGDRVFCAFAGSADDGTSSTSSPIAVFEDSAHTAVNARVGSLPTKMSNKGSGVQSSLTFSRWLISLEITR